MEIPWQQLKPETLRALIEEFATRDGTDYGFNEMGLETKISQVHELLKKGEIKLTYDAESATCNLIPAQAQPSGRKGGQSRTES